MRPNLRWAAAFLGVAAIAAGGVLFFYMRPLAVEVARIEEGVPIQVYGLGTVEGRVVSEVGFEVANTLIELHADHADRVAEGDVLARLHQTEQKAVVTKAAATVSQAAADLEMARARVERAEAVLEQKEAVNRRRQDLARRNVVSVEAAEEAQMEVQVAQAELDLAQSEVAVAEAALGNARAQHELEEAMLAHHTLTAPYDAVVVQRHKELGTVLASGEPVFMLLDPNTVWVLAYVDEARAGGLRIGQPAEIRLRSLPRRTFTGHVARIGIESDRVSEERRVYVAFERIPDNVHLHEQAEVLVTTGRLERALLVPQVAVEGFDGTRGIVWTVQDGRLARNEVRFGERSLDGRLEIVDGLPADAEVVAEPAAGLREGRRASVRDEAAS